MKISGIARHGRLKKRGPWAAIAGILAGALAVVLVATLGVGAIAVKELSDNVTKGAIDIDPGHTPAPPPGIGAYPGGFNILIVGSDTRAGQGGIGGDDGGAVLNDVTMLLHVSGDHTNATAVSIPRDMVVRIAACSDGGPGSDAMNTALFYGGSNSTSPGKGLPCVVSTVEGLTGLKIQFAGLITFTGVIEMSNAVGGVPVCIAGNIDDSEVGLHLKAGTRTLKGYTALKFLRSRHGVGDGSDLSRISSQQVYLSALVRKLKDNNTLSDVQTLYKIASAATRNMQLSTSLASADTMFAIAQALKNIPLDRVVFVQYPGTTGQGGIYSGKVAPIQSVADQLFSYIRADKPFKVGVGGNNRGSVKDPHAPQKSASTIATPAPTSTKKPSKVTTIDGLVGQSASEYTCSRAFGH